MCCLEVPQSWKLFNTPPRIPGFICNHAELAHNGKRAERQRWGKKGKTMENYPQSEIGKNGLKNAPKTQRALRGILMHRGKNWLPTLLQQFLTRNYPHNQIVSLNASQIASPPHRRLGLFSSFKIAPVVRAIARQLSGRNCLAAICASRHQDASPGPLGRESRANFPFLPHFRSEAVFPFFPFFPILSEVRGLAAGGWRQTNPEKELKSSPEMCLPSS